MSIQTTREDYMMAKFLGLVGRMRKHQLLYFKHKMDHDKKQAINYERLVDDYIKLLLRSGVVPIFDDKSQGTIF